MFLCNRNLLELLDIFLILFQATNVLKNAINICFLICYWLIYSNTCLFIFLPVYRWVLAKTNKTDNRNGRTKGELGVGRSAAYRMNWTETRTKYICQSTVDPCTRASARSDQERYGRSLSNLPRIVRRLTNIIISDRRYSLCYRKTLRECKAAESVFSLDKP